MKKIKKTPRDIAFTISFALIVIGFALPNKEEGIAIAGICVWGGVLLMIAVSIIKVCKGDYGASNKHLKSPTNKNT